MKEIYRVLVPEGRACINIANLGRKPYIYLFNGIRLILILILIKGGLIIGNCSFNVNG